MMSLATNPAVCMALTQRCKTALLESTLLYQQVQETNDELVFCLPHRIVGLSLVHNGILKKPSPHISNKKKKNQKGFWPTLQQSQTKVFHLLARLIEDQDIGFRSAVNFTDVKNLKLENMVIRC